MIPLKDNIISKHFPIVNWLIIFLNLCFFIYGLSLSQNQREIFFNTYGMVPARTINDIFGENSDLKISILTPFLTNMFLHGGFWHLLGNMWFLFIFGDNVEDRMGSIRYFFFYIITGILASLTHLILHINSPVITIGASGAISGVMAAYMFMFPKSRINTLIPIFIIIPLFVGIPSFIYIGIWFILQLLSGTATIAYSGNACGIAFWAHIGGFLAGILLYKSFLSKRRSV